MKKLFSGLGQTTPYKPWSKQRRLEARYRRLQKLHSSPNEPIKTIKRAHEGSCRADKMAQEDAMNQHVKAKWSDQARQEASARSLKQHRRRKTASVKKVLSDELRLLKGHKLALGKDASVGELLKIEGAIAGLQKAIASATIRRPRRAMASTNGQTIPPDK